MDGLREVYAAIVKCRSEVDALRHEPMYSEQQKEELGAAWRHLVDAVDCISEVEMLCGANAEAEG